MAETRVRRSPLSRTASLLMILLGVVTFILVDHVLGAALTVLGVAMLLVYVRLTAVQRPRNGSTCS